MKYIYLVEKYSYITIKAETQYLDKMSDKGWELVCVNSPSSGGNDKYYFRKQVRNEIEKL